MKILVFSQNQCNDGDNHKILLLGTDGVWEVENHTGEIFGKERIKALISKYASLSARKIADKVIEKVERFIDFQPLKNDITPVIIKIGGKD